MATPSFTAFLNAMAAVRTYNKEDYFRAAMEMRTPNTDFRAAMAAMGVRTSNLFKNYDIVEGKLLHKLRQDEKLVKELRECHVDDRTLLLLLKSPASSSSTTLPYSTSSPVGSTSSPSRIKRNELRTVLLVIKCDERALKEIRVYQSIYQSLIKCCKHVIHEVVEVYCNIILEDSPLLKQANKQEPGGLYLILVAPPMYDGEYKPEFDGDLLQMLCKFNPGVATENAVASVFGQVAKQLAPIHALGLVHGDLSLNNVLCMENFDGTLNVVLDGLDKMSLDKNPVFNYNKLYASPELLRSVEESNRNFPVMIEKEMGACAEVWALGIVLYVMLAMLPFHDPCSEGTKLERVIRYLEDNEDKLELPANLSPDAEDLLRKMLNPIARDRITMEHVLCHPFVTRQNDRSAIADSTGTGEDPE